LSRKARLDVDREWEKFAAHHKSYGKRMVNWDQAWVTWYVNAIDFMPHKKPGADNVKAHNAAVMASLQKKLELEGSA
jgi:hypothetical protein